MFGLLASSSFFATAFTGGIVEMARGGMNSSEHVLLNGSVVAIVALLFIVTFVGFIVALGLMLKSRTKADMLNAKTVQDISSEHRQMVADLTEAQNIRVERMSEGISKMADIIRETSRDFSKDIGTITEGHIRATAQVVAASHEEMSQFIAAERETSHQIGSLVAILNGKPCVAGTILEALKSLNAEKTTVTDLHKVVVEGGAK
jgi:phosphate/sulfate permease